MASPTSATSVNPLSLSWESSEFTRRRFMPVPRTSGAMSVTKSSRPPLTSRNMLKTNIVLSVRCVCARFPAWRTSSHISRYTKVTVSSTAVCVRLGLALPIFTRSMCVFTPAPYPRHSSRTRAPSARRRLAKWIS